MPADARLWNNLAKRFFSIDPPLRPSAEDTEIVRHAVEELVPDSTAIRAMILGVTPEFVDLNWGANTDLIAIDHNQSMIDAVWPGPEDSAINADWTAMPLPDASRNVALCDGGLTLLDPEQLTLVAQELRRVISPNGLFIVRAFVPQQAVPSTAEIINDFVSRRVEGLSRFKIRLWTSLQNDPQEGVQLAGAWNAIEQTVGNIAQVFRKRGVSEEAAETVVQWRGNRNVYRFPTPERISQLFCDDPGGFKLTRVNRPGYVTGDQCPTLVFLRV